MSDNSGSVGGGGIGIGQSLQSSALGLLTSQSCGHSSMLFVGGPMSSIG